MFQPIQELFSKLFSTGSAVEPTTEIIAHFSWENQPFSALCLNVLRNGLTQAVSFEYDSYMNIVKAILKLSDSLRSWRADIIAKILLKTIYEATDVKKTEGQDKLVHYFVEIVNEDSGVKLWVQQHHDLVKRYLGRAGWQWK